jgi:hypothetical protein
VTKKHCFIFKVIFYLLKVSDSFVSIGFIIALSFFKIISIDFNAALIFQNYVIDFIVESNFFKIMSVDFTEAMNFSWKAY